MGEKLLLPGVEGWDGHKEGLKMNSLDSIASQKKKKQKKKSVRG